MKTFERAEARSSTHARHMLRDGYPPDLVVDSMITAALAVWGAQTGNKRFADVLVRAWVRIRDIANGS